MSDSLCDRQTIYIGSWIYWKFSFPSGCADHDEPVRVSYGSALGLENKEGNGRMCAL